MSDVTPEELRREAIAMGSMDAVAGYHAEEWFKRAAATIEDLQKRTRRARNILEFHSMGEVPEECPHLEHDNLCPVDGEDCTHQSAGSASGCKRRDEAAVAAAERHADAAIAAADEAAK